MASSVLSTVATFLFLLFLFFVPSTSTSSEAATGQTQGRIPSPSRKILSSTDEEEYPSPHPTSKQKKTDAANGTGVKKTDTTLPQPTTKPKKTNSTTTATGKLSSVSSLSKTLNSTSRSPSSPFNSTKLAKLIKPNSTSTTGGTIKKDSLKPLNTAINKITKKNTATLNATKPKQQQTPKPRSPPKPEKIMPSLEDTEQEESDLVSEFRDLPSKFQDTLLPDLEQLSTKSKAYLTLANKEFAKSFKPIVGHRYASGVASVASAAFLLLPLSLAILLVRHLRPFLSLQKILLSVHIYLATYFSILSVTALLIGLEPLRFFHATSRDTYVYTQVLQTLGYVLYLLLQMMNLVVVFSGAAGLASRALCLAQAIVGLAIGLHYYAAVFHRAVLGQPPKTNWKIHAVYATGFVAICALARADRRKKAYLQGGSSDYCKKS